MGTDGGERKSAGLLDKLPHWLLVVFALLTFFGISAAVLIHGTGSTTHAGSTTGTRSTVSGGGGEKSMPAKSPPFPRRVHLSTLTPTAGDVPTRGNVQLAGQQVPHSVVYEKVGHISSTAKVCEANAYNCLATSYHLEGSYHRLAATLGLIETDSYTPQDHWKVFVDSELAQEGKLSANATVPLSIPLSGNHLLELRTEMEGTFNSETTSVVWADARVE